MRLRPVPLLAATLLAAAVAAGPTCGPRGLRATYRFDLARASAGEVDVRLSLEGRLPRPLVLRGLLRDRLNGLVGVSAEWAGGALPVQHEEGSSGGMPSTR